jgi:hypothetical protein
MADIYRICNSCGNFFTVQDENSEELYCSRECYKEYLRCMLCGNYFEVKEMIKFQDGLYCRICSDDLLQTNKISSGQAP